MVLPRLLIPAVLLLLGGCTSAKISTYAHPGSRRPIERIQVSIPDLKGGERAYLASLKSSLEKGFSENGVLCEPVEPSASGPRTPLYALQIKPLDPELLVKTLETAPQLGVLGQARFLCTLSEGESRLTVWTGLIEIQWTEYRLQSPGVHPQNQTAPSSGVDQFVKALLKEFRTEGVPPLKG